MKQKLNKLRKRWQQWRFYRRRPELAELHNVVRTAVAQGKTQRKEQ